MRYIKFDVENINDGQVPVSSTPKFMSARPPEMGGYIFKVMKLC